MEKSTDKTLIIEEYIKYLQQNGKDPNSVFAFCNSIKIEEKSFYEYFNSFDAVKSESWKILVDEVIDVLMVDENYTEFTVREKYLAYCFTLIEVLKESRSYFQLILPKLSEGIKGHQQLSAYRAAFNEYIDQLLLEGKQSGEISNRPLVTNLYDKGFYTHQIALFKFHFNDVSPSFTKTDQFIEKSVNLTFDMLEKGVLESGLDFIKFIGKEVFA